MRAAFAEIVDYAGLFPPATCSMVDAVRQYDAVRRSPGRWLLGRFVVAAVRLQEMAEALEAIAPIDPADPWRLSVVLGAVVPAELARVAAFQGAWESRAVLADSIEFKVSSPGQVATVGEQIPRSFRRFFEVPGAGPYHDLVSAIGRSGAFAKIRTGGTTPELFPPPADVTTFLIAAVKQGVAFKATAGLHHPFRGTYPITYAPDAAPQLMHGFVNLLLATAEVARGGDSEIAQAILEESERGAFGRDDRSIVWRDQRYPAAELASVHRQYFLAVGSCSFCEPHDELALGQAE